MTSDELNTNSDSLHRAIGEIEALGLVRPTHLTLRRYLSILKDHRLVSERTCQGFLEAHNEANYAAPGECHPSPSEIADRLVLEITQSVEASPACLADLKESLSAPPSPLLRPPPSTPAHEPGVDTSAASMFDDPGEQPAPPTITQQQPTPKETEASLGPLQLKVGRKIRHAFVVLLLFIWTGAAVLVGYATHERIAWGLHNLTAHILDLPVTLGSGDHHLESARRMVVAHPSSIGAWRSYADQAFRRDRPAEGMVALRRLVSLQPENAQSLNELAWLLCTAEDPTVRDPIQALALAEKAYTLDPSPAITDTLAEAAFQNGDPLRAVTLEEEALSRLTTGQDHYLRQLEKFRAVVK